MGEFTSFTTAFTRDGNSLVVGTGDQVVSIIRLEDEQVISSIPANGHDSLYLSPDGVTLVIPSFYNEASETRRSQIWDLTTGQLIAENDPVRSPSFSADSRSLVAVAEDGTVQLLDPETGQLTHSVPWPATPTAIAFGPLVLDDGSLTTALAAGTNQQTLQIILPASREVIRQISVPQSPITAVAFHPSGQVLATATSDGLHASILILDAVSGDVVRSFDVTDTFNGIDIHALAFSEDGASIAARTTQFGGIIAWDLSSGEELVNPGRHVWFRGNGIGASPNGHLIEFEGDEAQSEAFDRFTGELLISKQVNAQNIPCQFLQLHSVSSEGQFMAIGCDLPSIEVWDLQKHTRSHELFGHGTVSGDGFAGTVMALDFAPSGHVLASSSFDGVIILWDAGSGRRLLTITEHMGPIHSVAWSPDGRFLASASYDGTLRLWGLP
jgi:WD40 repeat protein